jgi:hypothetical protein
MIDTSKITPGNWITIIVLLTQIIGVTWVGLHRLNSMQGEIDALKAKEDVHIGNWHQLDMRLVRIETAMGINPDIRFVQPKLGQFSGETK